MSEDDFVKSILTGLTPPPSYFPKNVLMNINGYESQDIVMKRANTPLNALQFEIAANETSALVLDTRNGSEFAKGFIPNSVNIGLEGNFAQMVGDLILDIKQQILIITETGKEEESIIRLSRIGFDNVIGYLKGGINTWKTEGKKLDHIERISAQEMETRLKARKILVVDVRRKSEYDAEHIVDALNIPLREINDHLAQIPKESPFILHCAGGYRSMIAASILKQRGWNNFVDVVGGFNEMKNTTIAKTQYVCPTTLL